tara:strand:- start:515 stop:790 length:276 start_codon:yes stop_codon:yes gene_type:complete
MKSIIALLLLSTASGIRHDSIWDDAMGAVDSSDYNKSTPKEYKEADKPKVKKVDYEAMYKKQRAEEEKVKMALVQKEDAENKETDMDNELY